MTVILGVDHATVNAGIALMDDHGFSILKAIDLREFPNVSPMMALHNVVRKAIQMHAPDVVATEKPASLRGGDTARKLIEVYAGVLLAAEFEHIEVVEVMPKTAKLYAAGTGDAEKEDVAQTIVAQFRIPLDDIAPPFYYKNGKNKGKFRGRLWDISDACALCIAAREIKRMEAVT